METAGKPAVTSLRLEKSRPSSSAEQFPFFLLDCFFEAFGAVAEFL